MLPLFFWLGFFCCPQLGLMQCVSQTQLCEAVKEQQPINQTTHKPTSQPANQPTSQPANQPTNQKTYLPLALLRESLIMEMIIFFFWLLMLTSLCVWLPLIKPSCFFHMYCETSVWVSTSIATETQGGRWCSQGYLAKLNLEALYFSA